MHHIKSVMLLLNMFSSYSTRRSLPLPTPCCSRVSYHWNRTDNSHFQQLRPFHQIFLTNKTIFSALFLNQSTSARLYQTRWEQGWNYFYLHYVVVSVSIKTGLTTAIFNNCFLFTKKVIFALLFFCFKHNLKCFTCISEK